MTDRASAPVDAPRRTLTQRVRRELKRHGQLYLMIVPVILGFLIFKFAPLAGLVIAFKNYNFVDGLWGSPWVGLANFERVLSDPFFLRVLRNTFVLGVATLVFTFPLPIIFALALNEVRLSHQRFKTLIQSLSYLPHFVSTVVIIGIVIDLFSTNGLVNQTLASLGLQPGRFLSSPDWFRPLYLGSYVWQNLGWSSIIYVAALSAIPPERYEAAAIDGATRMQRLWHITLPGIMPVIIVLFVIAVGDIVRVGFERVYFLQVPATYETSDVLETYVYRRGLRELNYSYGAAVGLFNSLLTLVLVWTANWLVTRGNSERRGLW